MQGKGCSVLVASIHTQNDDNIDKSRGKHIMKHKKSYISVEQVTTNGMCKIGQIKALEGVEANKGEGKKQPKKEPSSLLRTNSI